MVNNTIKLLDVVALTVDIPEYNLWRGQVGTVVELLADGAAFEVEFSDRNGRTYESVGLHPEQIMAAIAIRDYRFKIKVTVTTPFSFFPISMMYCLPTPVVKLPLLRVP